MEPYRNISFYLIINDQAFAYNNLEIYLKTLPINVIFSTRKRFRLLRLSGVEYPPRKPAPSANASSSSIVAPHVTHKRISLNAEALKYVVDINESRIPRATAIPAAKGNV